jgi:hypothetical protein
MKDQEINEFTFTNHIGEEIKYSDVVSGKYSVTSREDLDILQSLEDADGWEAGLFTDTHRGETGKTHESIYLEDGKKIIGSYETICLSQWFTNSQKNKNKKVIEFGCNLARNLRLHQSQFEGFEYFGIDINQEVVEKNREYFGENGKFFRADIFETDFLSQFDDNEFSLGFSDAFLQCLPCGEKKKVLIQEMLRICGVVIFAEYTNPPWDYEKVVNKEKGHQTAENLRIYSSKIHEIPNSCQPNQKSLYVGCNSGLAWPWSPISILTPSQFLDNPEGRIPLARDDFFNQLILSGQIDLNDI